MAERRMLSKRIVESARFLRIPMTAQMLYFHLVLNADDDGIVEAFPIMRMVGCSEEDINTLSEKGFIRILNEDMVSHIVDWEESNHVRADRKTDSIYKHLLLQHDSEQKANNTNTAVKCQPSDNQVTTKCQHSIGKDSIGKDSIGKDSIGKDSKDTLSGKPDCEEDEETKATIQETIAYLNEIAGKNYKATTPKTKSLIKARLAEGFTLADFKTVIDKKCREWGGSEMDKYLRPETLFGTKFEGYLNQSDVVEVRPKSRVETPTDRVSRMLDNILSEEVTE